MSYARKYDWTPERLAYLVANYKRYAIKDIATRFGMTETAVRYRMKLLKLRRRA